MSKQENEYQQRLAHFDGPLMHLIYDNTAVCRIAKMYARGEIVTKEEALSQMVIHLARNWEAEAERYLRYQMMFGPAQTKETL